MDMTRQLRVIGKSGPVANLAIVRDVNVRHDPVVIAHARNATVLDRTEIECTELANRVPVTNFEAGWFTGVLLVLGNLTD
jgi:hypothetical protein